MSQNKTFSTFARIVTTTFIASAIAVTYNNCGQRAFQTFEGNTPVQKLQDDLVAQYGGKLSLSTCQDSSRYLCHHRVFSADLKNNETTEKLPCVKVGDGQELCPAGMLFEFDSSAAEPSVEFEEFNCMLLLPNDNGSYPLMASAESYEESMSQAYNLCMGYVP